jgi:HD-like signal output (HDOD) protein
MKGKTTSSLLRSLESGYALRALSPVAVQLVELASDESSSAWDLAAIIEKDPSLTVRLMRLANSAFFQATQPVSTLKQAIVRVGFHRLRIMALSLSLKETFPMGKVGPMDYEKFWKTSVYRSILAKSLSQHLKTCNPEEAFVAGLVQEVGLLIFFDLFLKGRSEALELELDNVEALLSWEREHYEIDHRMVGGAALKYWGFPDNILKCQGFYGNAAKSKETPPLARICALATESSGILFQKTVGFHKIFQEMAQAFGLNQELVNSILLSTFEQVQEIADCINVELDSTKDLIEVMGRANQVLGHISEQIYRDGVKTPARGLPAFDELHGEGDSEAPVFQILEAVAHEIRNPIQAVGGFARKLSAFLDPASEGGQYAQIILEEAMRLEKALEEMTHQEGFKNR